MPLLTFLYFLSILAVSKDSNRFHDNGAYFYRIIWCDLWFWCFCVTLSLRILCDHLFNRRDEVFFLSLLWIMKETLELHLNSWTLLFIMIFYKPCIIPWEEGISTILWYCFLLRSWWGNKVGPPIQFLFMNE